VSQLLLSVLSRWEIDPPVICAAEAQNDLGQLFEMLRARAILRTVAPAAAFTCTECGQRCRVNHVSDQAGTSHGYIHCRDCGVSEVPASLLERWEVDAPVLLATAFQGIQLSVRERVAGHLWQVGKASWAGRSREVWFARCFRQDAAPAVIQELQRRPKAILFAPTETGAGRWQEITRNLVLALESTLLLTDDGIGLDTSYVESRIVDAGQGTGSMGRRRPKKRGDRAANIEALKKEMIQHLRAARDYAFAQREQTGEPALLPRLTQKALGKLAGLSESDVSRCLSDPAARELQLYWETALDLDQIMSWNGPIATGAHA
jgi:hypothetical protein